MRDTPCVQMLGEEAASRGLGVSEFQEQHRDTHDFARRVGRLPEQRGGDRVDYRPLLHRDGSVLSGVTLSVRGALVPASRIAIRYGDMLMPTISVTERSSETRSKGSVGWHWKSWRRSIGQRFLLLPSCRPRDCLPPVCIVGSFTAAVIHRHCDPLP